MYYFKGVYLGRMLNSGFVLVSGPTSLIVDPTLWFFDGKWKYREDLVEKLIEYLERAPRPIYVFVTHEHKDHADVKVLEILQKHFSARIYVPASIKDVIRETSLLLTSLQPINIENTVEIGNLKIKVLKGGDTENASSYLVETQKKTIYFTGDKFSEWQEMSIDYMVLPLWFIEKMHDEFKKMLEKIKFGKIILSHFDSEYHRKTIEKVKREFEGRIIVLPEFSDFIAL